MLVRDLPAATEVYGAALGGDLVGQEETAAARRAFFALGDDTVVDLHQPLSPDTAEGRDLEGAGEGIFGVTFRTADAGGAAAFLREKGVPFQPGDDGSISVAPGDAFGMAIGFTPTGIRPPA